MKMTNVAGTLILLVLSVTNAQGNPLHIHVLDVGEGQSVLLRQKDRAILIDSGNAGQVYKVMQRMRELGVGRLDYLLLTHLHPDHASGYFTVQHHYPNSQIIDNCQPVGPDTRPDMVRWVAEALEMNTNRRCVSAGESIDWANVRLQILWPIAPPTIDGSLNHQTLVILIEYRAKAERALLNQNDFLPVDVLVVGHHGAADASSGEFIKTVRPDYAVISTDADNVRGYPDPDVVRRLQIYSNHLHKTWKDGEFYLTFE